MAWFLVKTEPSEYSYEDLEAAGRDAWTGVSNAAAQAHLRAVAEGDEVFVYHTGGEKAIVGRAVVVRGAYPDPDHPGVTAKGDPKRVLVDLRATGRSSTPLTLSAMRGDAVFAGFALLTQSRLSVMPVPVSLVSVILERTGL